MSNRKKSSIKYARQTQSGTSSPWAPLVRASAAVALIVLAAFTAYLASLSNGFVWDDDNLLTNNRLIRASDGPYRFWCTAEAMDYWPVTNTAFWIEWRLWGMNPGGYHVTNLILHIVESLLIWLVLRKLSVPGAILAALIFAVHPVNVESVAWISQQKNLTAMLFLQLSILWYLKADMPTENVDMAPARSQGGPRERVKNHSPLSTLRSPLWYWLSLAAFVLAMLSKGSAAVLPILLLGIVWWLRPQKTVPILASTKMGLSPYFRRDLLRTAPFFMIAAALAAVNVWFQTHGTGEVIRTAGFVERLLGAGSVIWFYLYKAVVPLNLIFVYPQWHIEAGNPLWWLPLLAALIVTAVLWLYRKSWSRPFLFAWGFFCAALVPVMGFTDIYFMRYSLVADHYQHLAVIGAIALAAAGWCAWRQRIPRAAQWKSIVVVIAALMALMFLTWRQNGDYRDTVSLYEATLEKNPNCWMAHNDLGGFLLHTGHADAAIEHLRLALQLKPDYLEAHNNLGMALDEIGRHHEAIEHLEKALGLKKRQAVVHYNLGNALVKSGRSREAIEHYEQALLLEPNYPEAHGNLGSALAQMGRLEEAIEHYQQALRQKPDFDAVYSNLVSVYVGLHRPDEAVATAQKALDIARSRGQAAQAKQIEDWLNSYRAELSAPPSTPH